MSRLAKINVPETTWVEEKSFLEVRSPHAFTQAAGYLKYVVRNEGPVYYRGQADIYPNLFASLYRSISGTAGMHSRERALHDLLADAQVRKAFLPRTPEYSYEPLLQQYGISTRWLDLVDNVWVALWFACHRALVSRKGIGSLHFERRVRPYPTAVEPEYAYVLLVHSGPLTSIAGDGLLDVDVEVCNHDNVSERQVLPSSSADEGRLVKLLASFRTAGCSL